MDTRSAKMKARWADEAEAERLRQSMHNRSAEAKAATSAALKERALARWADPEQAKALSTAMSQGQAACWSDPVRREARLAKLRATRAAKKAAATKENQNG